jgi:hypothetical protein
MDEYRLGARDEFRKSSEHLLARFVGTESLNFNSEDGGQ